MTGNIPSVGQIARDIVERGPLARDSAEDLLTCAPLGELAKALAEAQKDIKAAKKDANNPFYHSKYATLAGIWEVCRDPLTKNGLAITQTTDVLDSGKVVLITRLIHTSGAQVVSRYPVVPTQDTPQGYGSALTYARRYCLSAMVGVAPDDDDDGNEASRPRDDTQPATHRMKPALVPQEKPEPVTQGPSRTAEPGTSHWRKVPNKFTVDALWEEILTRVNTVTGESNEDEAAKVLKEITKSKKFGGWLSIGAMRAKVVVDPGDPWKIASPWTALNAHPVYGWPEEDREDNGADDPFEGAI